MYPAIREAGAALIAISPMKPDNSLLLKEKHELTFDVLSDAGNAVARQFGIVFRLDDALLPLYEKFGIDVAGTNGDESFELPVPATYVVASDRRISYAFVDVDHTVRMEPADMLEELNKISGAT